MHHTPPVLSLSDAAFELFLGLLAEDRITRTPHQVTVHADVGDAVWIAREGRWLTAAPGFDTARRFGSRGTRH